jgi:hypothetical protein
MHEEPRLTWRRVNANPLVTATPGVTSIYKASGRSNSRPTWTFYQKVLEQLPVPVLNARGFVLDIASDLEDPAASGRVPISWLKYGNSEEPNSDGTIPIPNASEHFWRTMVANRDSSGGNPPPFYSTVCRNVFREQPGKDYLDLLVARENKLDMIQHEFLQRVEGIIWNRRLTRTNKYSFLSLVPEKTQPGDFLCIIAGCSVPVVLSKRTQYGEDMGYFSLVGESYVHGMMEGEAFDLKSEHGIPWETFRVV